MNTRPVRFAAVYLAMSLPMCTLAPSAACGEQRGEFRDYEKGPLSPSDFGGTPPANNLGAWAFTTTDIVYDFRYRYQIFPDRAVVTLAEMKLRAVVKPKESWNRHPNDVRLMDHEQGHFDLAYIATLAERSYFEKLLASREGLSAVGPTRDAAVEKLTKAIEDHMAGVFTRLYDAHQQYDRETKHGLQRDQQTAHRRQQAEKIQKLLEEAGKRDDTQHRPRTE